MRALALLLLPGCLAIGPDNALTTRHEAVGTASATAATAAAILGAYEASDHRGGLVAKQAAFGTAAALLPSLVMFGGEDEPQPTSLGEIYAQLGRGLGGALLAGLASAAPMLATYTVGEGANGSRDSHDAALGTAFGTIAGTVVALAAAHHVPRWARVPLAASLIGTLSTLGYQLGSGARPW